MSQLDSLLMRLSAAGTPQRVARILEWVQATFQAEGVAVFVTSQDPDRGLETRAAIGELSTTAPLLENVICPLYVAAGRPEEFTETTKVRLPFNVTPEATSRLSQLLAGVTATE